MFLLLFQSEAACTASNRTMQTPVHAQQSLSTVVSSRAATFAIFGASREKSAKIGALRLQFSDLRTDAFEGEGSARCDDQGRHALCLRASLGFLLHWGRFAAS